MDRSAAWIVREAVTTRFAVMQVYGTDAKEENIVVARNARYSKACVEDLPASWLEKDFVRDKVVFHRGW